MVIETDKSNMHMSFFGSLQYPVIVNQAWAHISLLPEMLLYSKPAVPVSIARPPAPTISTQNDSEKPPRTLCTKLDEDEEETKIAPKKACCLHLRGSTLNTVTRMPDLGSSIRFTSRLHSQLALPNRTQTHTRLSFSFTPDVFAN